MNATELQPTTCARCGELNPPITMTTASGETLCLTCYYDEGHDVETEDSINPQKTMRGAIVP